MTDEPAKTPERSRFTKGGKNLAILGAISIVIALATTGVSLAIYHNSGDIYLDRSRPGFLPEEGDDAEKDPVPEDYDFGKSGPLTIVDIEEYLENLDIDIKALDSYKQPFDLEILSNENLGIPSK